MTQQRRVVEPDDLAVTLRVRDDLGPQHDEAVVGEFLDRVGDAIDARVDERVAAAGTSSGRSALPYASLALGIPITAVAGGVGGLGGVALAWAGIAVVNVADALRR